jgi:hypothetical protein
MHVRSRFALTLLVAALTGGVALFTACGDGSTPAPISSTVYPTSSQSPGTTLAPSSPASPTAGETTGGSPSPTATATSGGGGTGGGGQTTITDKTIRANILRRLAQSAALNGLLFKVAVRDRVVYLRGIVKTDAQKQTAEQIAVTEPGIDKVVSYVFVETEGNGGY